MTTNSSAGRRSFATVADNLVGIKDPSMGDERERDIMLRAGTTAMTVSIYTIQALGVLLAVIGVGLWSGVVIAAAVIPGAAYTWYCQSSGINPSQSYAKIALRRRNWSIVIGLAMAAAWIGALSFHMLSGSPLVPAGIQGTVGTGNSTAIGLVVGGLIGGTIGVFTLSRSSRAGAKRNAADDEDDED
jgi:hypothetical protein